MPNCSRSKLTCSANKLLEGQRERPGATGGVGGKSALGCVGILSLFSTTRAKSAAIDGGFYGAQDVRLAQHAADVGHIKAALVVQSCCDLHICL